MKEKARNSTLLTLLTSIGHFRTENKSKAQQFTLNSNNSNITKYILEEEKFLIKT